MSLPTFSDLVAQFQPQTTVALPNGAVVGLYTSAPAQTVLIFGNSNGVPFSFSLTSPGK